MTDIKIDLAAYQGHRIAHETVWNVPYAHFFIAHNGSTPT